MSKQILNLPIDGKTTPLEFDWDDVKDFQFASGPKRDGDGNLGDAELSLTLTFDRDHAPVWKAAQDG
jgi:hypothetical protein